VASTRASADCTLSGQPPYNCQGCDLSGMNLAGKDLTGAQLQGSGLRRTVFKGVLGMAGADLSGARMDGTDFSGCDLSGTVFGPEPSFGSSFTSLTKFAGARVPYSALGTRWSYVDLRDAVLLDLPQDLSRLEVRQSDLSGTDFSGRTLKNAHFHGVVLQQAKFSRGTLDNIVFTRPPAHSQVCDLTGAEFCGAELTAAVFDTSTLTSADFTGAKLEGASFLQTRMDGTRFDNTNVTTCAFSASPRFSANPSNLTSFRGATLNYATLLTNWSYLDLTGATLAGLSHDVDLTYLQALYAVLGGMDLSNYVLNQCDLTGATLTGTRFTGAQMNDALLYGVQNRCELFRVPMTSPGPGVFQTALDGPDAKGVAGIFNDHGYRVSGSDVQVKTNAQYWWTVTDTRTGSVYPVTMEEPDLVVMATELATRFDNAILTGARFSPDDDRPTVLRGVCFTDATLDNADLSSADLGPVNPHDLSTASRFTSASMNNAGLSQAKLAGARLTGTVYLHQANLAGATLANADLTGAQLGALSECFRVMKPSEEYQNLLGALNTENAQTLAGVFGTHKIPVTPGRTSIAREVPGRSWTITDSALGSSYTVLHWTSPDDETWLIVSAPTEAATLTGARMPGARLVDANLYGVDGVAAQLSGANLNGAILDNCKLAGADLSRTGLSVQGLYNVDLSYANLIHSTVKMEADLTENVTLSYALLQGTDFTGTKIGQADLTGAAVAVSLPPWPAGGVYLFSIDAKKEPYAAELQAAVTLVSLGNSATYLGDLNNHDLTGDLRSAFHQSGVDFSAVASIETVEPDISWLIHDPKHAGTYTVWNGSDNVGNDGLFSHSSLPRLERLFQQHKTLTGLLRARTIVWTKPGAQGWMIDNDSENQHNMQFGYSRMLVTEESESSLAFYGTCLRLQYLDEHNQPHIQDVTFHPTALCESSRQLCGEDGSGSVFGPKTVCPNGKTLEENQKAKAPVPWEKMLRSSDLARTTALQDQPS
jgi:uncharacterized protein YjbI with pentapeptide repeats